MFICVNNIDNILKEYINASLYIIYMYLCIYRERNRREEVKKYRSEINVRSINPHFIFY